MRFQFEQRTWTADGAWITVDMDEGKVCRFAIKPALCFFYIYHPSIKKIFSRAAAAFVFLIDKYLLTYLAYYVLLDVRTV